jgi:hypothetical protein
MATTRRSSSVDDSEVARFSRYGADWWDPRGPMAALHKFNPVRLGYIRDKAAERFGRDPKKIDCLKGLRMLDIGCGGGILSEPLARTRMRKRAALRSITAPPRRRSLPLRPSDSTWCWRWKWSSTSSTSKPSSRPAARWLNRAG